MGMLARTRQDLGLLMAGEGRFMGRGCVDLYRVGCVLCCSLDQDCGRYTSSTGERRIRVHTMATPVVNELSELYRAADVGAIASLMSRLGEFLC